MTNGQKTMLGTGCVGVAMAFGPMLLVLNRIGDAPLPEWMQAAIVVVQVAAVAAAFVLLIVPMWKDA